VPCHPLDSERDPIGGGSVRRAAWPTGVNASVGSSHTCAVIVDMTARCWASNASGQLGDGTTSQRLIPVAEPQV
jgi:hypothetical protein